MTTSAPSPPVSDLTVASGSEPDGLTTTSAPNIFAASNRVSARSIATT
jgi:hypothetical protein